MYSIRTYKGPLFICASCGQSCGNTTTEMGNAIGHFDEQWDGIYCQWFPLAGKPIQIEWNNESRKGVQAKYPNTYPHVNAYQQNEGRDYPYNRMDTETGRSGKWDL